MKEFFADGVAEVGYGAGAVRIDFYTLGRGKDAQGNPTKELTQRVVMTPQGFIEAWGSMQGMADKLTEIGILKKREGAAAAPAAAPAEAAPPMSPNFSRN